MSEQKAGKAGYFRESSSSEKDLHPPKPSIKQSTAIVTVTKMMESLPIEAQDRIVDHLREYIEELQDEIRWDDSFKRNPEKLVAMAKQAKQEIAEGKATEMSLENARKIFRKYVPAGRQLSEELIQERRVEASRE